MIGSIIFYFIFIFLKILFIYERQREREKEREREAEKQAPYREPAMGLDPPGWAEGGAKLLSHRGYPFPDVLFFGKFL